jgi:hypothetical protein
MDAGPGGLLAQLSPDDREGALLGAAAVLASARRAGYVPPPADPPSVQPAEPETRPRCSSAAAQDLMRMLTGEFRELLPEWLHIAAARGLRAPETLLPDLLDAGRQDTAIRSDLLTACGVRARWLAKQNPDWKYALRLAREADAGQNADEAERIWETGDQGERVAAMKTLRALDPARARELMAAGWASEPGETRANLLMALDVGLDMADEPFLERALDDKAAAVRGTASFFLARMPESELVKRMIARIREHVTLRSRLLQPALFEVTLPDRLTPDMVRDGIGKASDVQFDVPEPDRANAHWLAAIVARTPLAFWTREYGKSAEEIVSVRRSNPADQILTYGWAYAVEHAPDTAWALPVLTAGWESGWAGFPFGAVSWRTIVPARELEGFLAAFIRANPSCLDNDHFVGLLKSCADLPAGAVPDAVIDACRAKPEVKDYMVAHRLSGLLESLSLYVPSHRREEFFAVWRELAEKNMLMGGKALYKAEERALFRDRMLAHLRESR